ncbi:Uncharacterized conserved protein YbgA, DUF1722 family [Halopseudomonas litoralis]|uniref:Uncharacterized conserved protein YbgA, DUF1722 family n=1 Tax=Halopseudomonas litoralis TaxID=797277 RepID=A0A1H1WGL0_9GAMM|nr:DUF1722 domain-containing protein [Halopseudomonas litoralis]SDS96172.1 Uncharacterized conserved protein YbgA, DUF1722 family [Halopseudomonas litoralis]
MSASVVVQVGISVTRSDSSIAETLAKHLELAHGQELRASLKNISGLILPPENCLDIDVAELASTRPDLPTEEEHRLADPLRLDHFLMRVHAYAGWQRLNASGLSRGALVGFHSRYKYQLMASSPRAYRELGHRLGQSADEPLEPFAKAYFSALMQALGTLPTPGLHTNVLMHIGGYFRRHLDSAARQQLEISILHYRRGIVPLTTPLCLLRYHLSRHPDPYLSNQVYLHPHTLICDV